MNKAREVNEFKELLRVTKLLNEVSMYQIYLQSKKDIARIEDARFIYEYCGKILAGIINGTDTQGHWNDTERVLEKLFPSKEKRELFFKRLEV